MAKILIAEDERDIRDLVAFTLRFAGHEVFVAANGEEAVQMAPQVNPDLVLGDLPLQDGQLLLTGSGLLLGLARRPRLRAQPQPFEIGRDRWRGFTRLDDASRVSG